MLFPAHAEGQVVALHEDLLAHALSMIRAGSSTRTSRPTAANWLCVFVCNHCNVRRRPTPPTYVCAPPPTAAAAVAVAAAALMTVDLPQPWVWAQARSCSLQTAADSCNQL
jgi:hypothetical protein